MYKRWLFYSEDRSFRLQQPKCIYYANGIFFNNIFLIYLYIPIVGRNDATSLHAAKHGSTLLFNNLPCSYFVAQLYDNQNSFTHTL